MWGNCARLAGDCGFGVVVGFGCVAVLGMWRCGWGVIVVVVYGGVGCYAGCGGCV